MAKMEQFKKWWLKFESQIDPDTYNGNEKEIRKAIARCTHRAALEWALEQNTWIGSDENGEWGIDKDEIRGELRGEES